MSAADAPERRPRWGAAVGRVAMSWAVAGVFAVMASLSGSQVAAGPASDPSASVVFWAVAGLFVAYPVASMPSLGFRVRRAAAWTTAAVVVVAVTLIGVFIVNTP